MKVKRPYLKQLIKEEIEKLLCEQAGSGTQDIIDQAMAGETRKYPNAPVGEREVPITVKHAQQSALDRQTERESPQVTDPAFLHTGAAESPAYDPIDFVPDVATLGSAALVRSGIKHGARALGRAFKGAGKKEVDKLAHLRGGSGRFKPESTEEMAKIWAARAADEVPVQAGKAVDKLAHLRGGSSRFKPESPEEMAKIWAARAVDEVPVQPKLPRSTSFKDVATNPNTKLSKEVADRAAEKLGMSTDKLMQIRSNPKDLKFFEIVTNPNTKLSREVADRAAEKLGMSTDKLMQIRNSL